MYPASELFRQYAEALTRSLDFQLVTAENTYTRKDFSEVAIDELISSGDELEIGSCAAARLQVTLLEGIDLPPGTELKPYIRFMGEENHGLPPNPRLVYETDTPAGTSVAAEYAVNGGAWQEVTSGGTLDTEGATTLAVRFRLATEDSAKTPVVTAAWLEDATGAKVDIDLLGAGQGEGTERGPGGVALERGTIQAFTESGAFTVPEGVTEVDVLVVAGGGGGGSRSGGGGGAAGGLIYEENYGVTPKVEIPVTVGAGGQGGSANALERGGKGDNSAFGALLVSDGGGGGGGASASTNPLSIGESGGSGGGGGRQDSAVSSGGSGGGGQGNDGGNGGGGTSYAGAGGGGAGGPGQDNSAGTKGDGGAGIASSISGENVTYAIGGQGSAVGAASNAGGRGGGGVAVTSQHGTDGAPNTGGGGGGGGSLTGNVFGAGGNGGSGVVIVKWGEDATEGSYTCPIDMHGAPAPPSEWMPLGVYYVDKKPTTRQTGDYTCLDKMAQAEVGYKSELTYPAAMQDVLIEALEQIAADSAYECYDGYMVNVEPIGYTIRDILGYIASAHGGCARFDRDGLFTVTELGGEPVYTIQRKNYNSQTLERDPFQVKQIDIVVTDDLTISRGEAEPYATIQYVNPWVTEDIADVIYAQLGGLRYHDMRLDMRGLPFLEPGDTVLVEDALDPGKTFPIIIMRQKFSFSGGLSCVLESHARSYNEGNFPRTSDLQKLVDNQTKQLQEVVYHIENASVQTLSSQLTRIADINFGAIVDANPLFNAEINLHVTAPGLVEFTYVLDNAPHHVAPLQTVGEGHYIIHLFLPLLKMSGAQGHSLQVFMRSDEARGTINRYQLQATVSGTGLASVATGPPEARIIEYVPDETVAPPEYGTVTAGEIIDGTPQISMQYPVPAGAADIVTPVQVRAYPGAAVSTSIVDSGMLGHQATIIASNDGGNRIILAFDQVLDGSEYEENVDAFFVVGNESGLIKQYTKTAIALDPQDASILYIDIAQGESLYNADGAMVTIEYRRNKGGLTLVGGIPILDFTINMGVE